MKVKDVRRQKSDDGKTKKKEDMIEDKRDNVLVT